MSPSFVTLTDVEWRLWAAAVTSPDVAVALGERAFANLESAVYRAGAVEQAVGAIRALDAGAALVGVFAVDFRAAVAFDFDSATVGLVAVDVCDGVFLDDRSEVIGAGAVECADGVFFARGAAIIGFAAVEDASFTLLDGEIAVAVFATDFIVAVGVIALEVDTDGFFVTNTVRPAVAPTVIGRAGVTHVAATADRVDGALFGVVGTDAVRTVVTVRESYVAVVANTGIHVYELVTEELPEEGTFVDVVRLLKLFGRFQNLGSSGRYHDGSSDDVGMCKEARGYPARLTVIESALGPRWSEAEYARIANLCAVVIHNQSLRIIESTKGEIM